MADLILKRNVFTVNATFSTMYEVNKHDNSLTPICKILEDVARPLGVKIDGETCIPAMKNLKINITYSNRFETELPIIFTHIVLDGQNHVLYDGYNKWTGIRIHPGNTSNDTEGCLLPGTVYDKKRIYNSRVAFDRLFKIIKQKLANSHFLLLDIEIDPIK